MRMFWAGKAGLGPRSSPAGWTARLAAGLLLLAFPGLAFPAAAQVTFEQAISDLASHDASDRLRAVTLLKGAAYPEAAIPLAAAVVDTDDAVQFEAIAAELNIFL